MAKRGAGRLDLKVAFQRLAAGAVDGLNEPIEDWQHYAWAWAHRRDMSDQERLAAGEEAGALQARFVVRSNTKTRALTTDDRLVLRGVTWNIVGVKQLDQGRNTYMEITAVVASDG